MTIVALPVTEVARPQIVVEMEKGAMFMILEQIVRLGLPLIQGREHPATILREASEIADRKVSNFFQHVIVLEVLGEAVQAWPVMALGTFGQAGQGQRQREVFHQDVERAVLIPFVTPSGGNPRLAQGSYASTYPVYDAHFRQWLEEDLEYARSFLEIRIANTVGPTPHPSLLDKLAAELVRTVREADLDEKGKLLGLVVLAVMDDSPAALYYYSDDPTVHPVLGESRLRPGYKVAGYLDRILSVYLESKLDEGAEQGKLADGCCAVCHRRGPCTSIYNKNWPLHVATWNAPFPQELARTSMVESCALCRTCYGALTCGGRVFQSLSKPLDRWLTRELFQSVEEVGNSDAQAGRTTDIFGCALVLPLTDSYLEDDTMAAEFAETVRTLLDGHGRGGREEQHLRQITGFELRVPAELKDTSRLHIYYYSGNWDRVDIHFRAVIEDVLPSTAFLLRRVTDSIARYAHRVAVRVYGSDLSAERENALYSIYGSLPRLLVRAYGGRYLWSALTRALHRSGLDQEAFLRGVARRLTRLSHGIHETVYPLQEEVLFFAAFSKFLVLYEEVVLGKEGDDVTIQRDWLEMVKWATTTELDDLRPDDVVELGFLAGYVVSWFSRIYWATTRDSSGQGQDYLGQRVLTFGSGLTPKLVWTRALGRMFDVAQRIRKAGEHGSLFDRLPERLRRLVAILLHQHQVHADKVRSHSDEYLAAFWSGYVLTRHRDQGDESDEDNVEEGA